ncbi:recQ-mediated instability protein (DUF1767) [Wolffia australiana]
MGRRRVLLHNADEDEDEDDLPVETLIRSCPAPSRHEEPLEISDGEDEVFVDVPDAFSPPAERIHDNLRESPRTMSADVDAQSANGRIDLLLRNLGLKLRREWLDSCIASLLGSRPGFLAMEDSAKAKLCFEQFLFSDMNFSGGGGLPGNVGEMHGIVLEGPFVLQVDEIVNISAPLRERYNETHAGLKRCLKLSLTDGVQRVYGMEYRPVSQIKVLASSGLKIALRNVHIRHGLLMLVPEAVEVLGGMAEELEAARGRFMHEISKPPRGRRKEPTLPLSKRASLAAWPSAVDDRVDMGTLEMQNNISTFATPSGGTGITQMDGHASVPCIRVTSSEERASVNTRNVDQLHAAAVDGNSLTGDYQRVNRSPSTVAGDNTDSVQNLSSNDHSGMDGVDVVVDAGHPLILSEERETPFTYMACFLAKRAAKGDNLSFVRGKIKCFLTGVKSFNFKHRSSYELRVYVDDGSLISEIFIDHRVVEKEIGHSPGAVTAALSSPDKTISSKMRDVMKGFQLFLMKFEGTMVLEMGQGQTTPLAVEMNQGFSSSYAWPLLARLKTFAASLPLR